MIFKTEKMKTESTLLIILNIAHEQGFTEHIYKSENENYWNCKGYPLVDIEILASTIFYDENDQRITVLCISANGGLLKGVAIQNG
jgi:hypothetical protein